MFLWIGLEIRGNHSFAQQFQGFLYSKWSLHSCLGHIHHIISIKRSRGVVSFLFSMIWPRGIQVTVTLDSVNSCASSVFRTCKYDNSWPATFKSIVWYPYWIPRKGPLMNIQQPGSTCRKCFKLPEPSASSISGMIIINHIYHDMIET